MRISRHHLRRRYSNLLIIDAGSQFSLRACSQAMYCAMFVYREYISPDQRVTSVHYLLVYSCLIDLFVKGEKLVPQPQSIIIDYVTTTRDKT